MKKVHNKYSDEKCSHIIKEYVSGKSTKGIALELGTYNTTIRRILIRNNIRLRSNAELGDHLQGRNPFRENSEKSNYFIGYIAADGNISSDLWKYPKNSVRLNTCLDPEILEDYKKWAGISTKTQFKYHKIYGTPEYCVEFCSKPVREYLISIGVTSNKSKTLKINIPLNIDFVRGVFDGDGCISKMNRSGCRFSISTASKSFGYQLYDFLKPYSPTIVYYNNIFTVSVFKKSRLVDLYKDLYSNATVFLKRKKDKFGSLLGENLV